MQKFFVLVFICAFTQTSFSQFKKGEKAIGGSFSFQTESNSSTRSTTTIISSNAVSIVPKMLFFLNEKIAIGGSIGYSWSENKNVNPFQVSTQTSTESTGINFIASRYFRLGEKVFFAINGSAGYLFSKTTSGFVPLSATIETVSSSNGVTIIFQPSFIFFPLDNWGFEAAIGSIGYSFLAGKITDQYGPIDQSKSYFFANALSVSLGVNFFLRKKT
jgi:hypothetical protein